MARGRRDANFGPYIQGASALLLSITVIVVALRFYVRACLAQRLRWDDWTTLIAVIFGIFNTALVQVAVHYGLGRHQFMLADPRLALKYEYIAQPFGVMAMAAVFGRISLALLLLSIVGTVAWRRYLLWTLIHLQYTAATIFVIIMLAQCRPIERLWDKSVAGSCWSLIVKRDTGYFQSSLNVVTDFVLAVFPGFVIWELSMKKKKKISLICLMGLGLFATAAAILKTYFLRAWGSNRNPTWTNAFIIMWITIEQYFVMICASFATLKPLYKKLHGLPITRGSSNYPRGRSRTISFRMQSTPSKGSKENSHYHAALASRAEDDDRGSQVEILDGDALREADI